MKNEQMKNMMKGAFLLSIASFIAKILSAVYRVPFQNMVGNTGFYVYQQIYPLYGIGMTFALSGFPVFFSKTIAEAETESDRKKLIYQSVVILSFFGIAVFALLYGFASGIAQTMGDAQLAPLIRSVSWMFLFMPLLATLRGYFQGIYRMEPTAISQVIEQLVRVGVILLFAYLYTQGNFGLYEMGSGAMSGAIWGAGTATLVLLIAFFKNQQQNKINVVPLEEEIDVDSQRKQKSQYSWKKLAQRYATEGLTICLLTSILVLFQLVDSFTLYKNLLENGVAEHAAKSLKGIYDRGQPLVQLGMVVGTGFSASFIPLMSRAYAFNREGEFKRAAQSLVRMTTIFSTASVAGLLAILPQVNDMLFGDQNGSAVLSIYIISIAAASVMMAYHSILQSLNKYRVTLLALVIGITVKVLANLFFVSLWGTMGASIATLLGLSIMAFFLGNQVPSPLKGVWRKDAFFLKLLGGCILLFTSAYATKWLLMTLLFQTAGRTASSLTALFTVVVGIVFFGSYLLQVRLLTTREWLSIPFGKKILKKLSIKK